jgi:hypothetical protein
VTERSIAWEYPRPASTGRWVFAGDYGAVGDGVTDDTAALLMAKAAAEISGHIPLLLMGNHVVTGPIDFGHLRVVDARPSTATAPVFIIRAQP